MYYIEYLQKKYKWKHPQRNVTEGDLVLLKEPNIPAKKWKLGRVLHKSCKKDR